MTARLEAVERESEEKPAPVAVLDHKNGQYSLQFRPPRPGRYRLHVGIFGRAIKNNPLEVISPCGP